MTNNVLYSSYVFGIRMSQIKSVRFDSNLIIGVTAKPTFV